MTVATQRYRNACFAAAAIVAVVGTGCAVPWRSPEPVDESITGRVASTSPIESQSTPKSRLAAFRLRSLAGQRNIDVPSTPDQKTPANMLAMRVLMDDLELGLSTEPESIPPGPATPELKLPMSGEPTTKRPVRTADPSKSSDSEKPRRLSEDSDSTATIDSAPRIVPSFTPEPEEEVADGELSLESEQKFSFAQTPPAHSPPRTGPRHANIAPDQFRDLGEEEMLQIALQHSPVLRPLGVRVLDNPASATTTFDPAIDANDPFFGPKAALAEFDTNVNATLNAQNNDRVFNNVTLGGEVSELTQDFVTANAGLSRRTTSGAILQLDAQHLYDNNNRSANRFRNYYETVWQAGIRQPLLRGGGRRFNLIAGPGAQPGFNFSRGILLARLNNQVTDADFEIAVRDYVVDLYAVYWRLHQSYLEYDAAVAAVDVAYQTWQSLLARRNAKIAGGEASKEAQARSDYYRYRRQLQVALGGPDANTGLYATERQLRRLMGLPIVAAELLRPTDPAPNAPFEFDGDELVARAMAGRTELRRQTLRLQNEQLRLVAAKNFLLPQLDGVGRYRLRGFGDDLTGSSRERFASAYDDFFSFDHQEWEFGVEMAQTVGRRQAKAAVRQAHLKVQRERSILDQSQRDLRHDIATAQAEVQTAWTTLQTTMEQLDASRERLGSSQALYEAGQIQIEFLLDAQADVLQAELQYAADQTRYALSLVGIGRSTGTLLTDIGIHVQTSDCGESFTSFGHY